MGIGFDYLINYLIFFKINGLIILLILRKYKKICLILRLIKMNNFLKTISFGIKKSKSIVVIISTVDLPTTRCSCSKKEKKKERKKDIFVFIYLFITIF